MASLNEFFIDSALRYRKKTALIFIGKKLTYGRFADDVWKLADGLEKLGVKKGDRVGIMLPNCPQNTIAYWAILKLGAIAVQFNPTYTAEEVLNQVKDSGAKVLITLDILTSKMEKLNLEVVNQIVLTSVADYLPFPLNFLYWLKNRQPKVTKINSVPVTYFKKLLRKSKKEFDPLMAPNAADSDVAVLQYTGGTTGIPKAAVLTHGNLISNIFQIREFFNDLKEGEEVMLAVAPFFHVFGMTVCQNLMLFIGGTIVLVPEPPKKPEKFKEFMALFKKYQITIFPGVPRLFDAMNTYLAKNGGADFSSLRLCISGSAKLPEKTLIKFEELTGSLLVEGYGLSETSPVTHCNPLDRQRRRVGSIGVLMPQTHAKIVDEQLREAAVGEAGELALRGPQVMRGYWNKPEETEKVLRVLDGEKWFFTGDVAKRDEDGFYYIVDRLKDMINVGGEKVFSLEVEEVISKYSQVQEVSVVGIKNSRGSEEVWAVIVKKDPNLNDEDLIKSIREFCQDKLAPFKIPSKIEFWEEIPKTTIGKPNKKSIREKLTKNRQV